MPEPSTNDFALYPNPQAISESLRGVCMFSSNETRQSINGEARYNYSVNYPPDIVFQRLGTLIRRTANESAGFTSYPPVAPDPAGYSCTELDVKRTCWAHYKSYASKPNSLMLVCPEGCSMDLRDVANGKR